MSCINSFFSMFRCLCEPGYTGQNCDSKYFPCDPSPCLNDGACKQIDPLTYECQCPKGKFSAIIFTYFHLKSQINLFGCIFLCQIIYYLDLTNLFINNVLIRF